ncbi:MAG: isoprenylcysteine carboxylmethyltransferase family protein, partial [Flavobacteriaceae bacterium]
MANNSFFNHLKNIILLPGTVTVLIPYLLYVYLNPFEITDEHMLLLIAGILFVCCGVLLLFRSIFLFSSNGKGTLAPWNPTRKLVISGLYSHVRNPMILGVLCILIGEAVSYTH